MWRDRLALLTLVLIAMLAAAPLWGPGMVNTRGGGDSPFLLQRTHQLVSNLRSGVFPVRWMPDAAYGLGFPFFNYYSALPYYMAGLLALVGLDVLSAIKLVQTVGFVASALGMYSWMRRITPSRYAAWLGGVAYTVAPFHLVNVYVRGDSLSEFYAFVFYPLILWGLDRTRDAGGTGARGSGSVRRWIVQGLWPGLAYAGLVASHNISALIFSPFILLYLLILVVRSPDGWRRPVISGAVALVFGLLLSAWVWIPALAERVYVQTGTLTTDYFHYSRHFRTLDLVQPSLLFSYSTAPATGTPFAMGLPQAVCACLGVLLLLAQRLRGRGSKPLSWVTPQPGGGFVLLGLLISTAMITPLSRFLWDRLPLLAMVQFPWRFLSVQALFAAAAAAALVPQDTRHGPWVSIPIAGLLASSVLVPLHPDRLPIGPADVTAYRLRLYELFTQNIGTTIRYEWLPQTTIPRPFTSDLLVEPDVALRAIPLNGAQLEAAALAKTPTRQEWRLWGQGGDIAFPLLNWPGWEAWVDGQRVDVWPLEDSGYLALSVPSGEHRVILKLRHTPVRVVAEAISLCALVVLAVTLLRVRRKIHWRPVAGYLALSLLPPLLFLSLPPGAAYDDTDLTMDFDQMPYLHHNPGGVRFGEEARLARYTFSAEELSPGETLTVTLDWSVAGGAYTATARLFSPAALRHEVESLAEASLRVRDGPQVVALRLPDDIARGVYLVQLRLYGPEGELQSLTPGGQSCGPLYLQPVRVPDGLELPGDAPVLAPFGPSIRLHSAVVSQLASDRLAVRLSWSTGYPRAANYGISLRLLNSTGEMIRAFDTQPGYGFLPTGMWRPGELVTDRYILHVPQDVPPAGEYSLQVILYHVATGEAIGQTRLGQFAVPLTAPFEARRLPRAFTLPSLQHPVQIGFGEEVRLAGYELEQRKETLRLTLWWQALRTPSADYTVFVHLFDPATEAVVVQSDASPQGGAYPTSWWATGEVVSETVVLSLEGLQAGGYRLALGLYDWTVTRLVAVDAEGHRVTDDRWVLPQSVEIR